MGEDGREAARRQPASPRRGIFLPRRQRRNRRRYRELFRLRNSFDFALLQPGDLVLVANPTDPVWIQATVFWSHVAIYVGGDDGHAFVDAVNLPVRRAVRRADRALLWRRVRYTSLRAFQAYVDILVLRLPLPVEARRAAADFARAQVGKPFSRRVVAGLFLPRSARAAATSPQAGAGGRVEAIPTEFTCASLIWHAYRRQGFDLSPGLLAALAPWPSRLGHDRRLQHAGTGTRMKPLRPAPGQLALYLARAWFRWVLRSDFLWRGRP